MTEKPVTVYYFQVEDFHTYHVGEFRILVHNADYKITLSREKYPESAKHIEDAIKNGQPRELTINRSGEKSNIKASLKAIRKFQVRIWMSILLQCVKKEAKGLMFVQSKDPIIEVRVLLLGIN